LRSRLGVVAARYALPRGEKLVADLEALGEAELLQLAYVGLELERLASELGRELRGRHARVLLDQLQRRARPRRVAIHSRQLVPDRSDVVARESIVERDLDAIAVAAVMEGDAIHLARVPLHEREQLVARREARGPRLSA